MFTANWERGRERERERDAREIIRLALVPRLSRAMHAFAALLLALIAGPIVRLKTPNLTSNRISSMMKNRRFILPIYLHENTCHARIRPTFHRADVLSADVSPGATRQRGLDKGREKVGKGILAVFFLHLSYRYRSRKQGEARPGARRESG